MKCDIWSCEKRPLTEVLSFIVDNRGKTVPTTDEGHILIATNCVRNESLYPSYEKVRYLSDETYSTWFRAHPQPGDILFVCKGTPGKVCMVPDPIDFCIAQDMVALRVDPKIIYNRYLLVVLRSFSMQQQIEQTSVGDVIPHFKKSFFDQLLIPIPEMEVQRIIGDYYFAFANKIEINKKINNNLEQQAQALFKSWFIDLEPFGGIVPSDWRETTLGEVTQNIRTRISNNFTPVFSAVNTGNLVYSDDYFNKQVYSKDISKYIMVEKWNFAYNPARINIGSIGINDLDVIGCVSPVYVVFSVREEYHSFFKFYFRQNTFKQQALTRASGSVRQTLSYSDFSLIDLIYPSPECAKRFDEIWKAYYKVIVKLQYESEKLSELRDSLLPRLMSGELDVSDIDL